MNAMNIIRWYLALATTVIGLLCAGGVRAEPVTILKDGPLYSEARVNSPVVTQLKKGMAGEAVAKQDGWFNVKTATGAGWIMSFNLNFGSGAGATTASSGGPSLGGLLGGGSGRVGSTTATIGIRGIDPATLRQATYSADQFALLNQYEVSKQDAQASAQQIPLTAVSLDYF